MGKWEGMANAPSLLWPRVPSDLSTTEDLDCDGSEVLMDFRPQF